MAFKMNYRHYDAAEGPGNARQWRNTFYERITDQEATEILEKQAETPFTILGILEGASKAEIKAAFRKLITAWHPDTNQHRIDEATEMSKKIIAAYTKLTA